MANEFHSTEPTGKKMYVAEIKPYVKDGADNSFLVVRDRIPKSKLFANAGVKVDFSKAGTIWLNRSLKEAKKSYQIGDELMENEARWSDEQVLNKETGEPLEKVYKVKVIKLRAANQEPEELF